MYIVLFYDTLCVDRLSLWICVLLSLSCILYFSGIVLYYLDCDVALYFHTLILYISLVILSMCIVMLCTSLTDWWFIFHRSFCLCGLCCIVLSSLYSIFVFFYIQEMVLGTSLSEWWFMLHWCCVCYQRSILMYCLLYLLSYQYYLRL